MLKMSALKVRVGDIGEDFDSVWNDYGSIQTDENGSDGECVPSLQLQDSSYSLFDQDLVFEDTQAPSISKGLARGHRSVYARTGHFIFQGYHRLQT